MFFYVSCPCSTGNNNNNPATANEQQRPRSTSLTNSNTSSLQSLSRSDERLDSTDSCGSDREPPVPTPRAKVCRGSADFYCPF